MRSTRRRNPFRTEPRGDCVFVTGAKLAFHIMVVLVLTVAVALIMVVIILRLNHNGSNEKA